MLDAAANDRQIATHTSDCYRTPWPSCRATSTSYAPEVRANLISAMRRDARIKVQSSGGEISRSLESFNDPVAAVSVHGPVTSLLEGLGPSHVDEVPVPVVALGGVASLLLLAGLGTSLARVRTRRLSR